MTVVYQYSKRIFPRWEGNKYLKQMEKSKYLMSLITHHKCFNFYLKTGFFQRFISPVLVKTQKIRGVFRGNKTTHS